MDSGTPRQAACCERHGGPRVAVDVPALVPSTAALPLRLQLLLLLLAWGLVGLLTADHGCTTPAVRLYPGTL
jgi:hypothetical protein